VRETITNRLVEQAKVDPKNSRPGGRPHDLLIWDDKIAGFGLRVTAGGTKSFVFQYQAPDGRHKRTTLGQHGTHLTVKQARKLAADKRVKVQAGRDPVAEKKAVREAPTVKDLADRFLSEHAVKLSASSQRNCKIIWDKHILPALGTTPLDQVTWFDLERLHYKMRETPYMANRTLAVASKAWALAARWGWWPRDRANPARGHDLNPERRRGRALEETELAALGHALAHEGDASLAAALRVCMLVGCRPSEVRTLKWSDLRENGRRAELAKSKTGPRSLYLGKPAADLIASQRRIGAYVFPGRWRRQPLADFKGVWTRVKEGAELEQSVRLYDACRHTFTTWALELGIPIERVKILIGHSTGDVTARYTHYRTSVLLADADLVSKRIDLALNGDSENDDLPKT
jgi:integrase